MSRWRLQPVGIERVLSTVEDDLTAVNQAWSAESLEEAMAGVDAAGPAGADVAGALAAVLSAQDERLAIIGNRVSAGLVGVRSAVTCFEAGQQDMLGQVQSQMFASAGSGDFAWWFGYERPDGAV